MSRSLHEATEAELQQLWPAVRASHLFASPGAFRVSRDRAPWCVQTNERGDAALMTPWRSHLDLLALRALWCSQARIPAVLDELRTLAREHGFSRLVSPLLAEEAARPYLRAGMTPKERIVALRASPDAVVRTRVPEGVVLRAAAVADSEQIAAIETASFDDFWRHGVDEIRGELADGRLVVACSGDEVLGYTLSGAVHGSATLGRLAVRPSARRQGIGSALLSEVAEYAEREGAAAITICTQRSNAASRALYARSGWRELHGGLVIAVDAAPVAGAARGAAAGRAGHEAEEGEG